ncbi:hypothetical protein HON71_02995 [Candidatus Woesearchaeota archaeon]|jgi:hypothetical protein|nr:hypothetical protein [Candidatus Woesearchaeota archaeon]MBT5342994.1 hypothetical protein [Candidatus Woesearchaeota archaeon]
MGLIKNIFKGKLLSKEFLKEVFPFLEEVKKKLSLEMKFVVEVVRNLKTTGQSASGSTLHHRGKIIPSSPEKVRSKIKPKLFAYSLNKDMFEKYLILYQKLNKLITKIKSNDEIRKYELNFVLSSFSYGCSIASSDSLKYNVEEYKKLKKIKPREFFSKKKNDIYLMMLNNEITLISHFIPLADELSKNYKNIIVVMDKYKI